MTLWSGDEDSYCGGRSAQREGIVEGVYYKSPKDFMGHEKPRLAGANSRDAETDEVPDLRHESRDLK